MLLHITSIMSELQIPTYKCRLFCDNISTIISHNNHLANYISPMSRLLASANIQLYKIADIIGCQKQDIVLYINQKRHTNFADCLTKFNIIDDTPQMWLDLQIQILDAKWLQKHPDTWYKDAIQKLEFFISKQAHGKSNEDPS